MRPNRAAIAAYVTLALLAVTFSVLAVSSVGFARMLSLRVAKGETHRSIQPYETCSSCHESPHKSAVTGACDDCHTTKDWDSTFNRRHSSPWLDTGAHARLACGKCHKDGTTTPAGPRCSVCHQTYRHARSGDCGLCHETDTWTNVHKRPRAHVQLAGDHTKATCPDCHTLHVGETIWKCTSCHKKHTQDFPLEGGHARACGTCHKVDGPMDNLNKVALRGKNCAACHKTRHAGVVDCARCHSSDNFKASSFRHDRSDWPLPSKHKVIACKKCHGDKQWAKAKPKSCTSCHKVQHRGLTDCARCHNGDSFTPSTFSHSAARPLVGKHATVACTKCHARGEWGSVKGDKCVDCHRVQHRTLTNCAECHTPSGFKNSTFVHDSSWPLRGAHKKLDCASCHPKKQWATSKGTSCVSCHGIRHGNQRRCDRCHTQNAWIPIRAIQHTPSYPLAAAHRYVDCKACHKQTDFRSTPTRCYDCHADVAHGGPSHRNCETCHTTVSWKDIKPHHDMLQSVLSNLGGALR